MSKEKKAYQAALQKISLVAAAGEIELSLTGPNFFALDSIPSELAALIGLQSLNLNSTKVNDLAPLAAMTSLQILDFSNTEVSDLRPIVELERLYENLRYSALRYTATPATKRDARLAELVQIEDGAECARETLAYLRTLPLWPEPYILETIPDNETPEPHKQDPALPLIWGGDGFSFFARSIENDPVTEAALDDLLALLADLRRKGNQHDDLYRIAEELQ